MSRIGAFSCVGRPAVDAMFTTVEASVSPVATTIQARIGALATVPRHQTFASAIRTISASVKPPFNTVAAIIQPSIDDVSATVQAPLDAIADRIRIRGWRGRGATAIMSAAANSGTDKNRIHKTPLVVVLCNMQGVTTRKRNIG